MKKFMKFLQRHSKKFSLFAIVAVALALTAVVATASFGPDRPTKVYNGPGTPGFDTVTFNSFTNVPNIGDERNFVTGKIAGADGGFYDPMTKLRGSDEVLIRVYVHNNADPKHNANGSGVAKNTKVRVQLPTAGLVSKNQTAKAFVSADNAQPKEIYDTLDMRAENGQAFGVTYVPGSASVTSNTGTQAVSDAIIGGGVNFGDQKGCFEYIRLVTLKVKITAPNYTLSKTVRPDNSTNVADWKETLKTKAGATVQWRINFKNTGSVQLKDTKIVDNLPANTTAVPGSVKLYDTNFPSGYQYPDAAIQNGGKQINLSIGNYNPNTQGFVTFKTKIADADKLTCGLNTLKNVAYATPVNGYGTITDDASVTVDGPECHQNNPNFTIVKDVRKKGDTQWQQDVTVEYGDTVQYRIVVKNTGDTDLKNVLVKDNRPTGVDYVNGTLKVNDASSTQDLFKAGVTIPEIKKGAQAEITFDAKVNKGQTDKCEVKKFRNIASALPAGLTEKTDDANVTTECNVVPAYACSAVDAIALGGNKYQFNVQVKTEGGVTVNKYTYDFGDATAPLSTDKSTADHQYAKPGAYNIVVRVLFNVGSEQKEARCTAKVVIPTNPCVYNPGLPVDSKECVPPTTPPVTTIPSTGAGTVVAGIFGTSATAYGVMALVDSRRALKKVR